VIALTLQAADQGDTTTMKETLADAGETVERLVEREAQKTPEEKPKVNVNGVEEVVADKGYHSGPVVVALGEVPVRSYIPEPKRGPRKWEGKEAEQKAVYGNRRRVQGCYAKRLLKKRGELIERFLRPLLRNRQNEASPPQRPREHFEAAVDSRRCVQLEPDIQESPGCGDAAGAEKSAPEAHFRVFMPVSRGYGDHDLPLPFIAVRVSSSPNVRTAQIQDQWTLVRQVHPTKPGARVTASVDGAT
jgi:hypothetical protein